MRLSWKDVFNSDHKIWRSIDSVKESAVSAGYEYFTWGNFVYTCQGFSAMKVCLIFDLN